MKNRFHVAFWVAIFFTFSNQVQGQHCNLLIDAINKIEKEQFDSIRLSDQTDEYYIKHDYGVLREKMDKYFSKEITDSLIEEMAKTISTPQTVIGCGKKIRLLNAREVEDAKKQNYESSKSMDFFKQPNWVKSIYSTTNPVFYRDYALIQINPYILSLNSTCRLLLLKKTQDGSWKVLEYLLSSAS